MIEFKKPSQEIDGKEGFVLNIKEFYNAVKKAISNNNEQSIYELSKIITRYYFKEHNF
jgi:hypothetical protein